MSNIKFVGEANTRQFQGRYLEPDEILDLKPSAYVDALLELDDFELVTEPIWDNGDEHE